jgi:hypothetical protein
LCCNYYHFKIEHKEKNQLNPNNVNQLKIKTMGSLLYVIAVILVVAWAIGFFAYSAGGIIHILLVIAIIAILFRIISGRKILD